MNVKLTNNQLKKSFYNLMFEYRDLEHTGKSYDYWIQEKPGYSDINVENYYKDIEEDWENDEWIIQYQEEPGDIGTPDEVPILRYNEWYFRNIITMLGKENFERLLGEWYTDVYGWPVKTVKEEE